MRSAHSGQTKPSKEVGARQRVAETAGRIGRASLGRFNHIVLVLREPALDFALEPQAFTSAEHFHALDADMGLVWFVASHAAETDADLGLAKVGASREL